MGPKRDRGETCAVFSCLNWGCVGLWQAIMVEKKQPNQASAGGAGSGGMPGGFNPSGMPAGLTM